MDPYQSSIDRAVKAWRSATENFTQIFESLATATAAHVSEEKGEEYGHAAFEEMAKTARAALDASRKFTLYEDRPQSALHASVASEEDTDELNEDTYDTSKRRDNDRRDQTADQRRQRRKRKLHKRVARLAIEATERVNRQTGLQHNNEPIVAYEDISAEIEARLRAKDGRKAAATKEKKRKRGSRDSIELAAMDRNAGRLDAKRAKLENTSSDHSGATEVRGKHVMDDDENAADLFHKRRKLSMD